MPKGCVFGWFIFYIQYSPILSQSAHNWYIIILPAQQSWRGVYRFHLVCYYFVLQQLISYKIELLSQESFPLNFYQFEKFSMVNLEICCALCNTKYLIIPHTWKLLLKYYFYIPPLQWSWTGVRLVSPCPPVHLSVDGMVLLCIFNNTCWIHFIFIHLIK